MNFNLLSTDGHVIIRLCLSGYAYIFNICVFTQLDTAQVIISCNEIFRLFNRGLSNKLTLSLITEMITFNSRVQEYTSIALDFTRKARA